MIKVLFVCLGNICRSPTAHGTFRKLVKDNKLEKFIFVDSAGTAPYHVGKSPDSRARSTAKSRGIEISDLRARQVKKADFKEFDYIIPMDKENLADLMAICPEEDRGKIKLFLSFAKDSRFEEVPDPYYGGQAGFELVFDLAQQASEGLLEYIQAHR